MRRLLDAQRRPLIDLMADRVIPTTHAGLLHTLNLSEAQLELIWIAARGRALAWEQALRTQGVPEERIADLRHTIDAWLTEQGLMPPSGNRLN